MSARRFDSVWIPRLLGAGSVAFAFALDLLPDASRGFGTLQWLISGGGALLILTARWVPPAARQGLLLLVASVFGSLGLAEATLRNVGLVSAAEPFRAHPIWLWEHIPGFDGSFPAPDGAEGSNRFRTNSEGHIGSESDGTLPRLVVYGDSFAAGREVPEEDRFAAQLQKNLARLGMGDLDVVNAGVRVYGPDQELLRMEADLRKAKPLAAVVLVYAGNDFSDSIRNGLFRLAPDGAVEFRGARLKPEDVRKLAWNEHSPVLLRLVQRLRARFAERGPRASSAPSATRIEEMLIASRERFERYRASATYVELGNDDYAADVALEPTSESARAATALFAGLVERMQSAFDSAGVPLLLVSVPFVLDVCPTHAYGRIDSTRFPDYRPSGLTDSVERAANRAGAIHLDLFPHFASGDSCGRYLRTDFHWNSRGNSDAAIVAADRLSRLLLEPSHDAR